MLLTITPPPSEWFLLSAIVSGKGARDSQGTAPAPPFDPPLVASSVLQSANHSAGAEAGPIASSPSVKLCDLSPRFPPQFLLRHKQVEDYDSQKATLHPPYYSLRSGMEVFWDL